MEFRKDYADGTVIRTLKDGLEGIIIGRHRLTASFERFIVEMRYGETEELVSELFMPIDDPVHARLDAWNAKARKLNYKYIFIGYDDQEWYCILSNDDEQMRKGVKSSGHFFARYYWPVRAY